MQNHTRKRLKRQLDSIIIHFDYDCFYASVFGNENPALKALPLAVQQKQIVVTCNYEARRRGLHKLQLIKDARRICPDVVIVLGEDLTRFRDASKQLYVFLKSFSWNQKVERLGFDEVFMDVSDIIDYNIDLLNENDLSNSFFCLSQDDPTAGFAFDASHVAGNTFPENPSEDPKGSEITSVNASSQHDTLRLRLHLASHLAQHLREALHSQKGYTCTVGVSTNKTLAKLVGNLHKPASQTTLLPPYETEPGSDEFDNVTAFIDAHEVGKIPGIGFKLAQKLRAHVVQKRPASKVDANSDGDEAHHEQDDTAVLVRDVRIYPDMSPETLERMLAGPGTPHGIGSRIWDLLNGCDDTEVGPARDIPRQISIEDTYQRLSTMQEVTKQFHILAKSLLKRMHADLLEEEEEEEENDIDPNPTYASTHNTKRRWLATPKTIRLSTRPRPPPNSDRGKWSSRISRSAPFPNFVLSQKDSLDSISEKLVTEVLVPLFRKLHPEKNFNLGLLNIAATNIEARASEKGGSGRNIAKMFRRQDDVLKQWRVEDTSVKAEADRDMPGDGGPVVKGKEKENHTVEQANDGVDEEMTDDVDPVLKEQGDHRHVEDVPMLGKRKENHDDSIEVALQKNAKNGSEDMPTQSQENFCNDDEWESGDEDMMEDDLYECEQCGATMPFFAGAAHERWHEG